MPISMDWTNQEILNSISTNMRIFRVLVFRNRPCKTYFQTDILVMCKCTNLDEKLWWVMHIEKERWGNIFQENWVA